MTVIAPVRISKIILRDFRAFPNASETYEFDLGQLGKSLLLFGENGSGKSSLFHALRLLLNEQTPKPFADYRHVFTKGTDGVVTVTMTAGGVPDFTWSQGAGHPTTSGGGQPFFDFARRSAFLDYKALLKTSSPFEKTDCIDLFDLVVKELLRNATLPSGPTVLEAWNALLAFQPKEPPPQPSDETIDEYYDTVRHWPNAEQQKQNEAESFWKLFGDLLSGIVDTANRYLSDYLQPSLSIELTPSPEKQTDANPQRKLLLTAKFANHLVEQPAQFLNEARLSAIALALYLAAVVKTTPAGTLMPALSGTGATNNRLDRLLVLDDPLLGLDISHRLPLLDLLQSAEFTDWQIILMTYDASWFEMACEQLPKNKWAKYRLHAKAHQEGWEMPVLETDAPYLDRALKHVQGGDFKAAGVYLRTAWENVMRTFCLAYQIKVPLRSSTYEYKAEEFWNLVKKYEFKPGFRLVDDGLAGEITICRGYVLNPLCHNDPARPTREEVRRAHGALKRLKDLLEKDVAWSKQSKNKGKTPGTEFSLILAGELLLINPQPLSVIASLLRNAFDHALWRFCTKQKISFTFTCDVPLTTARLWQEATNGAGGLAGSQAAFVTAINAHADLMVADSPDDSVFTVKTLADLKSLFDVFRGGSPETAPKMVMDQW
jgi:energy-coupling factor transporter ATP-binding protein EcfA2